MQNDYIGTLQTSINVAGREYKIRHDFRPCLDIMIMFEDLDLTDNEKMVGMLRIIYEDENVPLCDESVEKAVRFLNMGNGPSRGRSANYGTLYTWSQDSIYIFAAIDRVLGYSSRRCEYLHWWEFMGAFLEIGECTFSNIVHLRKQKKKGKLTKEEKEYWNENIDTLELQERLTYDEQLQLERFLQLAKGGGS